MKSNSIAAALACFFIPGFFVSANAGFYGRLETVPGSGIFQAFYDDQLDITWAASASMIGTGTWPSQVNWAENLTIGGIDGWRLPDMNRNGDATIYDCGTNDQSECMDNEYGHLYWYGAGTTHGSGITPANHGPFTGILQESYWSGSVRPQNPDNDAIFFSFNSGNIGTGSKSANDFFAWAVHDGDVGIVPIPAAVWLFATGLAGLLTIARRNLRHHAAN